MKIAHIADAHWGLGYPGPNPISRFDDITRVMDWSADKIIGSECDLVLFAGDAFKDAKVYLDRAKDEIQAFTSWLRQLSDAEIQVVVISGTPSHDAVAAYELIREMNIPRVRIVTRPSLVPISTPKGDVAIAIACIPGLNRSQIVTKEQMRNLTPREIHQVMTRSLKDLAWGFKAATADILLSHMTLAGADTGFDELLMEHEPILTHEAVSPFDLVCLGHIHRPQEIAVTDTCKAFYCGSPERLTFNDESVTPGFYIHDTDTKVSQFIETPARKFITIDIPRTDPGIFRAFTEAANDPSTTAGWDCLGVTKSIRNAIVRIRWACEEEQASQIDRKAVEKSLYEAGAFFVSEIRLDVEKTDRARDEEVTESLAPVEAVGRWGISMEIPPEKIEQLQAKTTTLLEEVV